MSSTAYVMLHDKLLSLLTNNTARTQHTQQHTHANKQHTPHASQSSPVAIHPSDVDVGVSPLSSLPSTPASLLSPIPPQPHTDAGQSGMQQDATYATYHAQHTHATPMSGVAAGVHGVGEEKECDAPLPSHPPTVRSHHTTSHVHRRIHRQTSSSVRKIKPTPGQPSINLSLSLLNGNSTLSHGPTDSDTNHVLSSFLSRSFLAHMHSHIHTDTSFTTPPVTPDTSNNASFQSYMDGRLLADNQQQLTHHLTQQIQQKMHSILSELESGLLLQFVPTTNPCCYLFGTKQIYCSWLNSTIKVRMGGGYVDLEEFIKKCASSEGRKCLMNVPHPELLSLCLLLQDRLFERTMNTLYLKYYIQHIIQKHGQDARQLHQLKQHHDSWQQVIKQHTADIQALLISTNLHWQWIDSNRFASFASQHDAKQALQMEIDKEILHARQVQEIEEQQQPQPAHDQQPAKQFDVHADIKQDISALYDSTNGASEASVSIHQPVQTLLDALTAHTSSLSFTLSTSLTHLRSTVSQQHDRYIKLLQEHEAVKRISQSVEKSEQACKSTISTLQDQLSLKDSQLRDEQETIRLLRSEMVSLTNRASELECEKQTQQQEWTDKLSQIFVDIKGKIASLQTQVSQERREKEAQESKYHSLLQQIQAQYEVRDRRQQERVAHMESLLKQSQEKAAQQQGSLDEMRRERTALLHQQHDIDLRAQSQDSLARHYASVDAEYGQLQRENEVLTEKLAAIQQEYALKLDAFKAQISQYINQTARDIMQSNTSLESNRTAGVTAAAGGSPAKGVSGDSDSTPPLLFSPSKTIFSFNLSIDDIMSELPPAIQTHVNDAHRQSGSPTKAHLLSTPTRMQSSDHQSSFNHSQPTHSSPLSLSKLHYDASSTTSTSTSLLSVPILPFLRLYSKYHSLCTVHQKLLDHNASQQRRLVISQKAHEQDVHEREKLMREVAEKESELHALKQTFQTAHAASQERERHFNATLASVKESHASQLSHLERVYEDKLRSQEKSAAGRLDEVKLVLNEMDALRKREVDELNRRVSEERATISQLQQQLRDSGLQYQQYQLELEQQHLEWKQAQAGVLDELHQLRTYKAHIIPVLQKVFDDISCLKKSHALVQSDHDLLLHHHTADLQDMAHQFTHLFHSNAAIMEEYIRKYKYELSARRKYFDMVQELRGNIRVVARVRPMLERELRANKKSAITYNPNDPTQLTLSVRNSKKQLQNFEFEYDHIFPDFRTQEEVFRYVEGMVTSFMDGFNISIFAYGQTGSGKTHTMTGPPGDRGVFFRALQELFHIQRERSHAYQYTIYFSMLEIYNETIRDLLVSPAPPTSSPHHHRQVSQSGLRISDTPDNLAVQGITEVEVVDESAVLALIARGQQVRATEQTAKNDVSSRSHSLVTLKLVGRDLNVEKTFTAKMNIIDLAGSERLSPGANTNPDRVKETLHINKSLSALGNVLQALQYHQPYIPFRDSRLTHLLKDSLGGHSKAMVIINLSPCEDDAAESYCSLMFGSRARKVEMGLAAHANANAVVQSMATPTKHRKTNSDRIFSSPPIEELLMDNTTNVSMGHGRSRSIAVGGRVGGAGVGGGVSDLPSVSESAPPPVVSSTSAHGPSHARRLSQTVVELEKKLADALEREEALLKHMSKPSRPTTPMHGNRGSLQLGISEVDGMEITSLGAFQSLTSSASPRTPSGLSTSPPPHTPRSNPTTPQPPLISSQSPPQPQPDTSHLTAKIASLESKLSAARAKESEWLEKEESYRENERKYLERQARWQEAEERRRTMARMSVSKQQKEKEKDVEQLPPDLASLHTDVVDLKNQLRHKDKQSAYFAKYLEAHGLPSMEAIWRDRHVAPIKPSSSSSKLHTASAIDAPRHEQSRSQAASSSTFAPSSTPAAAARSSPVHPTAIPRLPISALKRQSESKAAKTSSQPTSATRKSSGASEQADKSKRSASKIPVPSQSASPPASAKGSSSPLLSSPTPSTSSDSSLTSQLSSLSPSPPAIVLLSPPSPSPSDDTALPTSHTSTPASHWTTEPVLASSPAQPQFDTDMTVSLSAISNDDNTRGDAAAFQIAVSSVSGSDSGRDAFATPSPAHLAPSDAPSSSPVTSLFSALSLLAQPTVASQPTSAPAASPDTAPAPSAPASSMPSPRADNEQSEFMGDVEVMVAVDELVHSMETELAIDHLICAVSDASTEDLMRLDDVPLNAQKVDVIHRGKGVFSQEWKDTYLKHQPLFIIIALPAILPATPDPNYQARVAIMEWLPPSLPQEYLVELEDFSHNFQAFVRRFVPVALQCEASQYEQVNKESLLMCISELPSQEGGMHASAHTSSQPAATHAAITARSAATSSEEQQQRVEQAAPATPQPAPRPSFLTTPAATPKPSPLTMPSNIPRPSASPSASPSSSSSSHPARSPAASIRATPRTGRSGIPTLAQSPSPSPAITPSTDKKRSSFSAFFNRTKG